MNDTYIASLFPSETAVEIFKSSCSLLPNPVAQLGDKKC